MLCILIIAMNFNELLPLKKVIIQEKSISDKNLETLLINLHVFELKVSKLE